VAFAKSSSFCFAILSLRMRLQPETIDGRLSAIFTETHPERLGGHSFGMYDYPYTILG